MCAQREWLECALCSSKFHSSQKGNKCCDCGNSYHYKCAKVLRSQQGSKDWLVKSVRLVRLVRLLRLLRLVRLVRMVDLVSLVMLVMLVKLINLGGC